MALVALFADFIANEKPIVMKYENKIYFPLIKSYGVSLSVSKWDAKMLNVNWVNFQADWALRPLVPYSPTTQDFKNAQYTSPMGSQNIPSLRWRHWLGTEKLGRDILASLVHGTRIAFLVGILSMTLSTLIGILLGSIAGFYGDNTIKVSRAKIILTPIFVGLAIFYSSALSTYFFEIKESQSMIFYLFQSLLYLAIFSLILFVGHLLSKLLERSSWLGLKLFLPVDILVSRLIEIIVSIPKLFLVIAIVAVFKPSIFLVMAVIGLTSWTGIARFIRAELLRIKNLEYIEAAHSLGFSSFRIMLRHAVPNALSPVFITVAFGIASAILVEAFLSFIGIGIPPEVLTWGKMLSFARSAPSAWWLAIFPGFAIFLTVTLFNLIGEGLSDALDPRLKQ